MTPWQLASTSESSQQVALFCFCAKAQKIGFSAAKIETYWKVPDPDFEKLNGVPELAYFHHIPNGGTRGDTARSRAIAGGQLKAEGVKPGVLDCFWPLKRGGFSGLFIEMKKPALKKDNDPINGLSEEQLGFGGFAIDNGFNCVVCYTWLEAANALEEYYNLENAV
ncbi:MAG: hypothetical protein V4493_01175 [Pseudomonadota bacterium]